MTESWAVIGRLQPVTTLIFLGSDWAGAITWFVTCGTRDLSRGVSRGVSRGLSRVVHVTYHVVCHVTFSNILEAFAVTVSHPNTDPARSCLTFEIERAGG